jgi:hypothetical protein
MSNIDAKIDDYKQMIADLEKQKKGEEEAYKNTIDWNMEQLDKYVEEKELFIKNARKQLESNIVSLNLLSEISNKEQIEFELSGIRIKTYNNYSFQIEKRHTIYHHIFEFVYKILKYLFTSNKKMSNDYDNVISRLDKLEVSNKNIKEQLNILENENKYLKEKLYDLI